MKKAWAIAICLLLSGITVVKGQSSLGIDTGNYSIPATVNFNSAYSFKVNVKNYGPQAFSGPVDVMYAIDSNNAPVLDTTNSHISNVTAAVLAEQADSTSITINQSFRSGINTVVIWPRTTGTNFTTHDSLKVNIMVLGSFSIKNYAESKPIIFPNPTVQTLFVACRSSDFVIEQVRILDMTGQLLYSEKFKGSIDVSKLSAGTYTLEFLYKNGKTQRYKVIKE